MTSRRIKLSLVLGLALLGVVGASPADAARVKGVVVGKDRAHHALVVADAGSSARTIRVGSAFKLPVGARVVMQANRLGDGTFRSAVTKAVGRAKVASIRGVVLRLVGRGYLLGTGESVLLIKRAKATRKLQARTDDETPGSEVVVDASITKSGDLVQQTVKEGSASAAGGASVDVTGGLTELTPNDPAKSAAGSVTVQVESSKGSPASFTCIIPAAFPDLAAFLPVPAQGQPPKLVEMKCELVDGTWTLRRLSAASSSGSTGGGASTSTVEGPKSDDEVEVKGFVTALTPATKDAAGSVSVDPDGSGAASPVTCTLPAGFDTLGIAVGSYVELECEGGIVEELELEDEEDDDDAEESEDEDEDEEDDD